MFKLLFQFLLASFFAIGLFAQAPSITSYIPTEGCPGTPVHISGFSFNGTTAVKFGNVNARSFTVNSDNSITAVAGDGENGLITVTTGSGTASGGGLFSFGNWATFAYVIADDGYINVINTSTNEIVKRILVYAQHLTLSPTGDKLYVSDGFHTIYGISIPENKVTDTISGISGINKIWLNAYGTKLYVYDYVSNLINVYDTHTKNGIAGYSARDFMGSVLISADRIFLCGYNGITVIDAVTDAVINIIPIPATAICYNANDYGKIYVAEYEKPFIDLVDLANFTILKTISLGHTVSQLNVSTDGKLYATHYEDSVMRIINCSTNMVEDSIQLGFKPTVAEKSSVGEKLVLLSRETFGGIFNTATKDLLHLSLLNLGGYSAPIQFTQDIFAGCKTGNCASSYSELNATACNSYLWNGIRYTKTGTYQYHTLNAGGCDSIATLNLTIFKSGPVTQNVSACYSYTWHGKVYDKSGEYVDTLLNSLGCDSITILRLTLSTISAFLPSPLGDMLYVMNTSTNTKIGQIPVGDQPTGIAISGSKVYVTNMQDDNVMVIDANSNAVTDTIAVSYQPMGICITPDGRKIYVANNGDYSVSVIDALTNTVIKTVRVGYNPRQVCSNHDGKKVFVSCGTSNSVSVIDTDADTLITNITVGRYPEGLTVSPDDSKLYVTNVFNNMISIVDLATYTRTDTLLVGYLPERICFSKDGKTLYVGYLGGLAIVDVATNKVIKQLPGGRDGLCLTPEGDRLLVLPDGQQLNTVTNELIVDRLPWDLPYFSCFGNFIAKVGGDCPQPCIATTSDTTVNTCFSYTWHGKTYDKSGNYIYYGTNAAGCDSVVTLHLNLSTFSAFIGEYYSVSVYNISSGKQTDTFNMKYDHRTESICVSPDRNKIYVLTNTSDYIGYVDIIDIPTHKLTTSIPVGNLSADICISPDGKKIYVTNNRSNTISVIDAVNNLLTATITGLNGPTFMCMSVDGSKIFVSNTTGGTSVINTASNTITATIPVDQPGQMYISHDGSILYLANSSDNIHVISLINTANNSILSNIPLGFSANDLCLSPDGRVLYVSGGESMSVSMINTSTGKVMATVATAGPADKIRLSPDGKMLYVFGDKGQVINCSDLTIKPVDFATGFSLYRPVVIAASVGSCVNICNPSYSDTSVSTCNNFTWHDKTYTTSGPYRYVTTDSNGCDSICTLYLSLSDVNAYMPAGNQVYVFNTLSNTLVSKILLPRPGAAYNDVRGIAIKPDQHTIYVSDYGNKAISIIDALSNTIAKLIPVNNNPGAICVHPTQDKIYIANYDSTSISVIKASTGDLLATIPLDAYPRSLLLTSDGSKLYVIKNYLTYSISVINTATDQVVSAITPGEYEIPGLMCLSADGSKLYLVCSFDKSFQNNSGFGNNVYVINTANNAISLVTNIPMGSAGGPVSPNGISINPAGNKLFVGIHGPYGTNLVVYDLNHNTQSLIPFSDIFNMEMSPDGRSLFVCSYSNGGAALRVVDVATNQVTATEMNAPIGTVFTGKFIGRIGPHCQDEAPMLIGFVVENQNNNDNLISWTVANSTNIDHFDIERSSDSVNFTSIHIINVDGNEYHFTDIPEDSMAGIIYYRVKVVASDGSVSYGPVVSVLYERAVTNNSEYRIYPNPASQVLYIRGDAVRAVTITDNTGRRVLVAENSPTSIDLRTLRSGFYIVIIIDNAGHQHAKKLIIE